MKTKKPAKGQKPVPSTPPTAAAQRSEELLDMEQVIALLKTTRPTFYRWLRAGKLRGTKLGRQWRFRRDDVARFLQGQGPQIDLPADLTPLLNTLRAKLADDGAGKEEGSELTCAVQRMIRLAAKLRATDFHLEPQPDGMASLRLRLDGVLQTVAELDLRLLPAIIREWKTLAACDMRETTRPQEGRIPVDFAGPTRWELRVTFLPTMLGETLSAAVLDANAARASLAQLNYPASVVKRLDRWLASPYGTVVFTGPAGCGKTSALYACLNQIAAGPTQPRIVTVEAEHECLVPGTTQVLVPPEAGMSFGGVLRTVLRSSPDVIMVGEIRDLETLTLSLQAALTGHLVLISLHTTEAASALKRMADVGASALQIAEAVKLIVAQRLVRSLCPSCSLPGQPAEEILLAGRRLAGWAGISWADLPDRFRKPVGCSECNQTGYRGRMVIAEALQSTPRIIAAMGRGAAPADLRAIAVSEGMSSLATEGLRRAAEGATSLAEVVKTVCPVYGAEL